MVGWIESFRRWWRAYWRAPDFICFNCQRMTPQDKGCEIPYIKRCQHCNIRNNIKFKGKRIQGWILENDDELPYDDD